MAGTEIVAITSGFNYTDPLCFLLYFFVFQLFDAFVSFRKPETAEVEEEEELSPGMAKIIGKLDEQEKRFLTPFM